MALSSPNMGNPMYEYMIRTQIETAKKKVLKFPKAKLRTKLKTLKLEDQQKIHKQQLCSKATTTEKDTIMKSCLDNYSAFKNVSHCVDELNCCFKIDWNLPDPLNERNKICFKQKSFRDKCDDTLKNLNNRRRYCPNLNTMNVATSGEGFRGAQSACWKARCCFDEENFEKWKDSPNFKRFSNKWCFYM